MSEEQSQNQDPVGELGEQLAGQEQVLGDVRVDGDNTTFTTIQAGENVTLTQTKIIQISVDEIKTRKLITTSPYKGLRTFEPEDKALFFGRDQFLAELINELEQTNFILLLGASGSGKSSVIRAGLIPWLQQKWGNEFVSLVLTPDSDPFDSLYSSLITRGYKQAEARIARSAAEDTLSQVVRQLKPTEAFWLVFVDQFEELFTLSEAEKQDQFITSLVELSKERANDPLLKIVATMRADFLDQLDPAPANQIASLTQKHRPMITQMHPDELRLAIEQPAAHHGVVFEKGLVKEIIENVQGRAGYLPLLQYTLHRLWETDAENDGLQDHTLNILSYRRLGGVRGALQQRVDRIYQEFSRNEQDATKRIFLKLVQIGKDEATGTDWKPFRRRAYRSEFAKDLENPVLQKLINERLLVSNEDATLDNSSSGVQRSTVEIAHEILLTSWTKLNGWIKQYREEITLRNRLNDDVKQWKITQSDDELWSGRKLDTVVKLRGDPEFVEILGGFSPDANEFIDASVGFANRKRQEQIQQELKIKITAGDNRRAALMALLESCTVRLSVPGQASSSTGFFVAPGMIVTCAPEIVELGKKTMNVSWQDQEALNRYDLNLMSLESAETLPLEGKNLVILAKVGTSYHVRIFDSTGNIILNNRSDKLSPDETLVQELDKAPGRKSIDSHTKIRLIRKITSTLDYTHTNFSEATIDRLFQPDNLAILKLKIPHPEHPCVYLDATFRMDDPICTYGFSDVLTKGGYGVGKCQKKTRKNQHIIEFETYKNSLELQSSPLFNWKTLKVCGIVQSTHNRVQPRPEHYDNVTIGKATSAAKILAAVDDLRKEHRAFHKKDHRWSNLFPPRCKPRTVALASFGMTTLVILVRGFQVFQPLEFFFYDFLMRSRLNPPKPSDRFLIVHITKSDFEKQRDNQEVMTGSSLSDVTLVQLLEEIKKLDPVAIGLDVYRDQPLDIDPALSNEVEFSDIKAFSPLVQDAEAKKTLEEIFVQNDNLFVVCKTPDDQDIQGIAPPPPLIQSHRVGFSDFLVDADGVLRRQLLAFREDIPGNTKCLSTKSFNLVLAEYFLKSDHFLNEDAKNPENIEAIQIKPNMAQDCLIEFTNGVVLSNLHANTGGYQGYSGEDRYIFEGCQILLNYRKRQTNQDYKIVNLEEFFRLEPSVDKKQRIVLVGIDRRDGVGDNWATPFDQGQNTTGAIIQAQMIDQIIDVASKEDSLIWVLPGKLDISLVLIVAFIGGGLGWRVRSLQQLGLIILLSGGSVLTISFVVFQFGGWIPLMPHFLALSATGSYIYWCNLRLNLKFNLTESVKPK